MNRRQIMSDSNDNPTFGRLGRWSDVQKQIKAAKAAGAKVTHDRTSQTVVADLTGRGDVLFRALHKGGGFWIVIYTRKYYLS